MTKIFISYRRADSRTYAGRIYDKSVEAFGRASIFKDVDNIRFGHDFRGVLSEAVNQCDVMLVIIGQHWLNIEDESGNRRLDSPADFVRIEVQTGLQRGDARCLVIPVLVDGAAMPNADKLPLELRELAFKNAVTVHDDPDFHNDVGRLIRQLKQKMRPIWVRVMLSPASIIASILIIALVLFLLSRLIQNAATLPTPTNAALLLRITPQATKDVSDVTVSPTIEVITLATNTVAPTASSTPTESPSKTATSTVSFTPKPSATSTTTPSNTPTPSATPTSTLTPIPTNTAVPYVLRNADWKPVEQPIKSVMIVEVPAGCFDMGSENTYDDEKPVTHFCFDQPFWIDKTEVTNVQFTTLGGKAAKQSKWTDTILPRETITWFEARDFCEARGGRLPTEAEWEYAARGPDNLIYPWGSDFNAANVVSSVNSKNRTAPVGSKPSGASWVGALDLSGNVWEWVSTLYKPYPYPKLGSAEEHDNWIAEGNTANVRSLRGGSWNNDAGGLRAADRYWLSPSDTYGSVGFRCVVSAPSS